MARNTPAAAARPPAGGWGASNPKLRSRHTGAPFAALARSHVGAEMACLAAAGRLLALRDAVSSPDERPRELLGNRHTPAPWLAQPGDASRPRLG